MAMQVVAVDVLYRCAVIQTLCTAGCTKYSALLDTKAIINDKACLDVNVIVIVVGVIAIDLVVVVVFAVVRLILFNKDCVDDDDGDVPKNKHGVETFMMKSAL